MSGTHRTSDRALRILALLFTSTLAAGLVVAADAGVDLPEPDFKTVLSLSSLGRPRISPDGKAVLYTVRDVDWDENRYDTEVWVARAGDEPFQLTRSRDKSSVGPRWSPDGKWIAFLADRGDETQIHLIRSTGGEAFPLTAVDDGVSGFEWSPAGRWMAVEITDPRDEDREKIEESFGAFAVEDDEFRMTHLWILDVDAALEADGKATLPEEEDDDAEDGDEAESDGDDGEDDEQEPSPFRRLTSGDDFTVNGYRWSPDGTKIAFDHRPDTRVESFEHSDLSVVDVDSGEIRRLVELPGYDGNPLWSPDSRWILFSTKNGRPAYYTNNELAKIRASGGKPVILTASFDENPGAVAWLDDGIRFIASEGTGRRLYRLSADGGEPRPLTDDPPVIWNVDYTKDGRHAAFAAENADTQEEIYLGIPGSGRSRRVTRMTEKTDDWPVGGREVISWDSSDGARIEGVLITPEDFDRSRKHPLLVIIHGGPAGTSRPARVYSYVYPVQQWLARGAVILMPNYRGSAGYGEAFRSLNVDNLGVGDAWDVLSGVDHLVDEGFVDPDRVGAMGWSQGGYISAFLTTTSDRFRAISVGAGISNWMTYYVNTDIHPFTRHYLNANPWDDPEIYARTSPMSYIKQARTPTLIQHGEFDRRVPTPNAYELYQGLEDVGVDTRLVIYKGFGHGISKPKERLAAMWHNWQWFARHIWDEEVELPVE